MQLKLRSVKRMDCIRLDTNDKTYFTEEGYLIDHPILTSCGIFEYTNPNGSIRRELRLPEHVFAKQSLATYKGKPIIITHDAGVVNKNNIDDEQIGTILSEGYQDGDDVRAEIIIHNSDAMQECGLRELSLGYNLDLIEEAGEWNGEHYDAIQTNIVINHLALVANARAGEQARLNIDSSEELTLKGGKADMKETAKKSKATLKSKVAGRKQVKRFDSASLLTPEQMEEAITMYCKANGLDGEEEVVLDAEETITAVQENRDRRDEEEPSDLAEAMEVIAQQDEDINSLLQVIEQMKAQESTVTDENEEVNEDENEEENADENEKCDESKEEDMDESEEENSDEAEDKTINADSADRIVRERLAICRVGDKLNLDGLEKMSVLSAKKAIIKKVTPSIRIDGKSKAYINAAYDIAASKVKARKSTVYQKQQMINGVRADAATARESSAAVARSRMMSRREGGNE